MKVIAVDWDGTLVEYNGYQGKGVYGPPVPSMVSRVKRWLKDGHEVIIFTSRVSQEWPPDVILTELNGISRVLKEVGLSNLTVTANKYSLFDEFWDDKGVRVVKNTGKIFGAD